MEEQHGGQKPAERPSPGREQLSEALGDVEVGRKAKELHVRLDRMSHGNEKQKATVAGVTGIVNSISGSTGALTEETLRSFIGSHKTLGELKTAVSALAKRESPDNPGEYISSNHGAIDFLFQSIFGKHIRQPQPTVKFEDVEGQLKALTDDPGIRDNFSGENDRISFRGQAWYVGLKSELRPPDEIIALAKLAIDRAKVDDTRPFIFSNDDELTDSVKAARTSGRTPYEEWLDRKK